MTEFDVQKLLAEASQAITTQQYAAAEDLQRRAIQHHELRFPPRVEFFYVS